MRNFSDKVLEAKIAKLRKTIGNGLGQRDLWYDVGFKTFEEDYGELAKPLRDPCILILWFEGPFYDAFHGYDVKFGWNLRNEFDHLIDKSEFWYECLDHCTLMFFAQEAALVEEYRSYFDFAWRCRAVLPDYVDLDAELYAHFERHPDDLHKLSPRHFEILLDAIFRNQGYHTTPGPGTNDGGVDIRLYQHDTIGELVTLVQAKRYAKHRPVRLEAVAALKALVDDEPANRGLLVTTSRFLPQARRFAERHARRIRLADLSVVRSWCNSVLIEQPTRLQLSSFRASSERQTKQGPLVGKIFHGYDRVGSNRFCVVVKEGNNTVFVREIVKRSVNEEIVQGPEIPLMDNDCLILKSGFDVAKIEYKDCVVQFFVYDTLYYSWDGQPKHHCRNSFIT